jgi:predicted negative regulator of RcsB-dependent stress response
VKVFFLTAFLALDLTATGAPDWAHNITPILFQNCASCHHTHGPAPFPLESYADAKRHAQEIVSVTKRRYMPPWPPEAGYGDFQDQRYLTYDQIRTIAAWVAAGAPEGPASAAPAVPQFPSDWQLGVPDLILQAEAPFRLHASGPDMFWNFLFQPDLKGTRYVRAIEIQPGNARLVHHANLLVDRTGSVRRLEKSAGAGFPGMELVVDRSPLDPESHFLFWKPGSIPYSEPDGLAWRLDPGNVLILNTHLQPSGKPEEVQPKVGLYFTDKPPTKFPILIELENDQALNIPAGDRDFVVSDDFTLPVDADVLAVYPHAHYLGKLLEGYATLPDGTRKWLIRIPDWDLNWQAVYRYREPVFLPKGTVVSMRFHYDNSEANPRNPNHPPKRVEAGNNATDEMGHLWLQVLPRGAGDRRRSIEEALMRHRLAKDPNDFTAHLNLGAIYLSRLDAQDAATMLRAAVLADPSRPEAHDMLGSALLQLGRRSDAISEYQNAIHADPKYIEAYYDLANAYARAGNVDAALPNFREVVGAFPNVPRLRIEFGDLLARSGHTEESIEQYRKALDLEPSNETARLRLAAAQRTVASK